MRKVILFPFILLLGIAFCSFKAIDNSPEISITVTAKKATSFDMFHNDETIRGLKTPYKVTLKSSDNKFIFKSRKPKSKLKVIVDNDKSVMTGNWSTVVLLVEDQKMTTFGMD